MKNNIMKQIFIIACSLIILTSCGGNNPVKDEIGNTIYYINPDEVKQAIDNLEAVLKEQFKGISDALRGIEQDANEAVIVQGTKMSGTIEETCNALDAIPSSVMSQIGDLYNESVQVHDQLQVEFNEKAKNAAWGNNVVRVS